MTLLHQAKRVCLGLVSLCLSLTFLGALPGGVSPDRAARNPQRSRVSRCPRHRIVSGISQEPVTLHSSFIKKLKASDPPPVEFSTVAALPPVFHNVENLSTPEQLQALAALQVESFLARPPPVRIA